MLAWFDSMAWQTVTKFYQISDKNGRQMTKITFPGPVDLIECSMQSCCFMQSWAFREMFRNHWRMMSMVALWSHASGSSRPDEAKNSPHFSHWDTWYHETIATWPSWWQRSIYPLYLARSINEWITSFSKSSNSPPKICNKDHNFLWCNHFKLFCFAFVLWQQSNISEPVLLKFCSRHVRWPYRVTIHDESKRFHIQALSCLICATLLINHGIWENTILGLFLVTQTQKPNSSQSLVHDLQYSPDTSTEARPTDNFFLYLTYTIMFTKQS